MSQLPRYFSVIEVCEQTGLSKEAISSFIEREWISLGQVNDVEHPLDHEDLARIHFILELQHDFGVNDEGIPLILHLLDQLHRLHFEIEKRRPN